MCIFVISVILCSYVANTEFLFRFSSYCTSPIPHADTSSCFLFTLKTIKCPLYYSHLVQRKQDVCTVCPYNLNFWLFISREVKSTALSDAIRQILMPCTSNTMQMKQPSFSFSHITCDYLCTHRLKLTFYSWKCQQLGYKKKPQTCGYSNRNFSLATILWRLTQVSAHTALYFNIWSDLPFWPESNSA